MRYKINVDLQDALEYSVYMMIGSEFDNVKCVSKWEEKNKLVNYKEVRIKTQYMLEDICIKYIEKLRKELTEDIWKDKVRVIFSDKNNYIPDVSFIGKKYVLRVFCIYKGKRSEIEHELLYKAA